MRSTMPVCNSIAQRTGVDHAAELNDDPIASALDDAAVVHCDGRIDQVASKPPQPRKNPVLVGSGKPRIADDVGNQNRHESFQVSLTALVPLHRGFDGLPNISILATQA